jgi:hypothetical protein
MAYRVYPQATGASKCASKTFVTKENFWMGYAQKANKPIAKCVFSF